MLYKINKSKRWDMLGCCPGGKLLLPCASKTKLTNRKLTILTEYSDMQLLSKYGKI